MALTVAVVLEWIGAFARLDGGVAAWFGGLGLEGGLRPLPAWGKWGWVTLLAFGLPQAVLHVAARWQRIALVAAAGFLTLSWAPVLALAAHEASLGAAITAWLWASAGSGLYAEKHRHDR
jgi:hypothetical protein